MWREGKGREGEIKEGRREVKEGRSEKGREKREGSDQRRKEGREELKGGRKNRGREGGRKGGREGGRKRREGGRTEEGKEEELDNTCLLLTRGGSFQTGVAPGGSFLDMGGGGG